MNLFEKYIFAAVNLYGMVKESQVKEILKEHFPKYDDYSYNESKLAKNFIYKNDEYFLTEVFLDSDMAIDHIKQTKGKDYFIPEKGEFIKYAEENYLNNHPDIKKLEKYLVGRTKLPENSYIDIVDMCTYDMTPDFIFNHLKDIGYKSHGKDDYNRFANIINSVYHNVRRWKNNGFTDAEIGIEKILIPIKVGRNDPCPCGSGKKFKHCCMNKAEIIPESDQLHKDDIYDDMVLEDYIEKLFGLQKKLIPYTRNITKPTVYMLLMNIFDEYLDIVKHIKPELLIAGLISYAYKTKHLSPSEDYDQVINILNLEDGQEDIDKTVNYLNDECYNQTEEEAINLVLEELNMFMRQNNVTQYIKIPKTNPMKIVLEMQSSTEIDLDLDEQLVDLLVKLQRRVMDTSTYLYNLVLVYPLSYIVLTDMVEIFKENEDDYIDNLKAVINAFKITNPEVFTMELEDFYKYGDNKYLILAMDNLGFTYKEREEYKKAVEIFEEALSYDRDDYSDLREEILLPYVALNKMEEYENTLNQLPDYSVYYLYLTMMNLALMEESLFDIYLKSFDMYPNTMHFLMTGDNQYLIKLSERELQFVSEFYPIFTGNDYSYSAMKRIYDQYNK